MPERNADLLARYGIQTPMTRYTDAYDRKKAVRLQRLLDALERGDVALVSEAGMPLLSDPGYELVQAVLARGIEMTVVSGPTAVEAALSVSGLRTAPFVFLGFAPRKTAAREKLFAAYVDDERTLVLYESPNRLRDTMRVASTTLGSRPVVVACELTKMYEEVWRGDLGGAFAHFDAHDPRGEYVVVVGGARKGDHGAVE